jgi:hypothetical protein
MAEPSRGRAMGEEAYQRAKHLFDAKKNAAATIELYQEILTLS